MVGSDRFKRTKQRAAATSRGVLGAVWIICSPLAARAQDAAPDAPQTCTKAQFEAVVDEAGEALRNLNQEKKPDFQDRLRQLKDKRGWTNDEFLKAAAPFVKDDQIDIYDNKSNELLEKISSMGEGGAVAKSPDCATLLELHAQMKVLVETQNEKWVYMFAKLDAELQKQ